MVTAAQASPEGATVMGWKTNQGCADAIATVLLPFSSCSDHHILCQLQYTKCKELTELCDYKIIIHGTLFLWLDEGLNQSALLHSSQS